MNEQENIKFHTLSAIITFILLPPFWCLSVPALIFSSEAKRFHALGADTLAREFSEKSKKFITATWRIFIILIASALVLFIVLKLFNI